MDADLVILRADPAQNTSAFSTIRYTIRHGEIIYAEKWYAKRPETHCVQPEAHL
jgi:imidazolonepropionase-like amidohydrolase